ncbi:hypothetical protein AMD26_009095 [Deinococcus sp. UR1]|nr:hypothetical protein AMD26_009095 [Deinococcus sp. UR1]
MCRPGGGAGGRPGRGSRGGVGGGGPGGRGGGCACARRCDAPGGGRRSPLWESTARAERRPVPPRAGRAPARVQSRVTWTARVPSGRAR